MAEATFERLHEQAALQLEARLSHADSWKLLTPQPASGFALLPDPSPGDLFFDFEGNPFWDPEGSLEYLWGFSDRDDAFEALWATSREEEQAAFERFIDLVHARLAEHPDMHVYHYAQYEITALRRMMGRYGTREAELDDLLRREVFVDLYRVVRGGLMISRQGYGLKEIEHLLDFDRTAPIKDGGTSIVEFERWMIERDHAILAEIEAYNREDCIGTRVLADWLLERRGEALAKFGPFPLPEPQESKPEKPEKAERAALREELLATGDAATALAAELLDYHNRERKPVYWAMFDKADMTPEELLEDREAIGGLTYTGESRPEKKSTVFTFTYPAQEQKLGKNPIDQATLRDAGELVQPRPRRARARAQARPKLDEVPLPEALLPGGPYSTKAQEAALERIGRSLLAHDGRYPAIESVLRREPFDRDVQTNEMEQLTELLLSLDGRHLVIQGPPGSGKTYTSGRLIARLVDAGKRVGVASTSHRAIHKLLEEVVEGAAELGIAFRGLKKASDSNGVAVPGRRDRERLRQRRLPRLRAARRHGLALRRRPARQPARLPVHRRGRPGLARRRARDGHVGAEPRARRRSAAARPGAAGDAPGGERGVGARAPARRRTRRSRPIAGVFLETTYRLHPDICGFISEEFYESRLQPDPVTSTRTTPFGTGLRWLAVDHEGNRQESVEEAAAVRVEVERLAAAGVGARRDQGRGAVQRAGRPPPCGAAGRGRGRHRRQVPGPAGAGRPLLDGELERRGRPARPRVPLLAQPLQRRDLAGGVPCVSRLLAAAARGRLQDDRPHAARERAVSVRGVGAGRLKTAPPWAALSSLRDCTSANRPICSDF